MTSFSICGAHRSEDYMRDVASSAGGGGWWGEQASYAKSVVESLDEHRALKRKAKAKGFDVDALFVWFGIEKAKALMDDKKVGLTITRHGFLSEDKSINEVALKSDIDRMNKDGMPFDISIDMHSPILDRCKLSYTRR